MQQEATTMTRINLFRSTRSTSQLDSTSTLIFAGLLIACSLAVGCSSEKPKSVSSTNDSPIAQPTPVTTTPTTTPVMPVQQAAVKPVHKKIVHKAPPTLTYADKSTGVSFQYPRKYALKTGDAATELVSSGPIPMDFVQPGGVTLAAVSLPDSTYVDSNLALAFFNVSVNKSLTADQCSQFSVPQPDPSSPSNPTVQATAQLSTPPLSKLIIGDMELQSSTTTAGGETPSGSREETSKYYHVFQNGGCYEFALKVATASANTTQLSTKPVSRDEVFHRLEKILATVKINPVTAPEVNAEAKTLQVPTSTETPAQ
jgi:hypothetical protein